MVSIQSTILSVYSNSQKVVLHLIKKSITRFLKFVSTVSVFHGHR